MLHKMCFLEVKFQCYFHWVLLPFLFQLKLTIFKINEKEATEMISGISQKSYYPQGIDLLLDLLIVAN